MARKRKALTYREQQEWLVAMINEAKAKLPPRINVDDLLKPLTPRYERKFGNV